MKVKEKDINQEIKDILDNNENKSEAIAQAIAIYNESTHEGLVEEVVEMANQAVADTNYKSKLGLRALSASENKFYEFIKNPEQSLTATQIDIIPTSIIDRTLVDVKTESTIMKAGLIKFAPSGVKKWLAGSKTGAAAWGAVTSAISAELTATITSMSLDVNKLTAYCLIPKSIRELSNEFVDKYFMAILKESMLDGIEKGYLNGDGKTAPIGITKKVMEVNEDSTHKDKTLNVNVKGFDAAGLAPARTSITNNGKRAVAKLYLICNPLDEAQYVDPALIVRTANGGFEQSSVLPIQKVSTVNMAQGKAVLTIEGHYTMGFSGMKINEYKETKALEDADLLIAKVTGNGRADDDGVAYLFDVTKLEAYVPKVAVVGTVSTKEVV